MSANSCIMRSRRAFFCFFSLIFVLFLVFLWVFSPDETTVVLQARGSGKNSEKKRPAEPAEKVAKKRAARPASPARPVNPLNKRRKARKKRHVLENAAVVVFCFNRPQYLERTLSSLASLPFIEHFKVYISQDGSASKAVSDVAKKFEKGFGGIFEHWVKPREKLRGRVDGFKWLARHYKWALDRVFGGTRKHSHAILVEDDMEFSHDFLHLFQQTAWILDEDESVYCVSSWSDNNKRGLGSSDALFVRTSHFPGLGWMMKGEFYTKHLADKWPVDSHWDNWMRANMRSRDCVTPFLSRNHNFGEVGANMNKQQYVSKIAAVRWYQGKKLVDYGDLSYLLKPSYERKMRHLVSIAREVSLEQASSVRSKLPLLLEYSDEKAYAGIAAHFGIWDPPREHFKYLQLVEKNDQLFLIVDARLSPFAKRRLVVAPTVAKFAARQGQDCDDACKSMKLKCEPKYFYLANECSELKKAFGCEKGCIQEVGNDIPCLVSGNLPTKGYCVVKDMMGGFFCKTAHPMTRRLCVCV